MEYFIPSQSWGYGRRQTSTWTDRQQEKPDAMNINIDPLSNISLGNAKVVSDFLKVLGNENRLIILCALSKHELKVGEMEHLLGIRQPTLSQQLARLRATDLVNTRRVAKEIFYSLASNDARRTIEFLCELFGNQNFDLKSRRANTV